MGEGGTSHRSRPSGSAGGRTGANCESRCGPLGDPGAIWTIAARACPPGPLALLQTPGWVSRFRQGPPPGCARSLPPASSPRWRRYSTPQKQAAPESLARFARSHPGHTPHRRYGLRRGLVVEAPGIEPSTERTSRIAARDLRYTVRDGLRRIERISGPVPGSLPRVPPRPLSWSAVPRSRVTSRGTS